LQAAISLRIPSEHGGSLAIVGHADGLVAVLGSVSSPATPFSSIH
jgi:hypothetical protein